MILCIWLLYTTVFVRHSLHEIVLRNLYIFSYGNQFGVNCCSAISAEVQCGFPGRIDNGYASFSSHFTFGNTAKYNCQRGYRLVDNNPLVCAANGSWVGQRPHCQCIHVYSFIFYTCSNFVTLFCFLLALFIWFCVLNVQAGYLYICLCISI